MSGISGAASVAGGFPLSALRCRPVVAGSRGVAGVRRLWLSDFSYSRHDLPGHPYSTIGVVSSHVVGDHQEEWCQCIGLQRVLGLKSYETAWTWLHKLRRAMVRPGRDLLTGKVEVDEAYVGGEEEGLPGRLNLKKALIVVAAETDGPRIGRIRMRQVIDASAESLVPFVEDSVARGSIIHTDGWPGYSPLTSEGYDHEVTVLRRKKKSPSELLPRVHLVVSLLKRWLLGTHQGAVSRKHLDYYLDEFTFRFNRRRSKSRGKLFFRLAQQAMAVEPITYDRIVHPAQARAKAKLQSVGGT